MKIEILPNIFLWPQWNETKNQKQKESWKIHKNVEIKQHNPEQPMNQRENQKKFKKSVDKQKQNMSQIMGWSESRGVYGEKYTHSSKQPNFLHKVNREKLEYKWIK